MLREKAFDFWKTYIGLMTKGGVDVSMTNPAVTFTADAKAGEYDDISDEEYYELLDFTEELASFWKKNREATAGAVLLEALVNTDSVSYTHLDVYKRQVLYSQSKGKQNIKSKKI